MKTIVKSKSKKMTNNTKQTNFDLNKAAQKSRKEHGDAYENENQDLLTKAGIACTKDVVKLNDGSSVIGDHCYKEFWIESTTHFDKKRIKEFLGKKQEIEKATKKYKTFVLFYEKELTASTTKLVLPLEIDGWLIIAGEAQVNAYVSTFGRLKAFSQNGKVQVATPTMIPVHMLEANPLNRDEVKEGVVNIAKSIINDGFLTCLYVVPVMEKGKIVKYMLFEGHHRLSAVKLAAKWGHEIKELPCVVVDWVTTDDMERVSELLIKINVEYKTWKLRDYIKHHAKVAEILKLKAKKFSYDTLLELMTLGKHNGFGDNFLVYIFGKCYGASLWLDLPNIQDGEFRMTETIYNNYVVPFIDELNVHFDDAKANKLYNNGVYQYLCKRLFIDFKAGRLTQKDVSKYLGAYNMLGDKTPTKTEHLKEMWDGELLKQFNKLGRF